MSREGGHENGEPAEPSTVEDGSDIVEEESEDSFPASDAPSSWARSPEDEEQP